MCRRCSAPIGVRHGSSRGRERRDWHEELAAERVLAEGKVHGLARDEQAERAVQQIGRFLDHLSHADHEAPGSALNVRLSARVATRTRP